MDAVLKVVIAGALIILLAASITTIVGTVVSWGVAGAAIDGITSDHPALGAHSLFDVVQQFGFRTWEQSTYNPDNAMEVPVPVRMSLIGFLAVFPAMLMAFFAFQVLRVIWT